MSHCINCGIDAYVYGDTPIHTDGMRACWHLRGVAEIRMIDVDRYLGEMPTRDYKCWDFVRKVWRESFGVNINDNLQSMQAAVNARTVVIGEMRSVTKLKEPIDPCFIVFFRPRTEPHIGIYYQGNVLSLTGAGATYETIKNLGRRYGRVSYYHP